jgi:hypothetical protein
VRARPAAPDPSPILLVRNFMCGLLSLGTYARGRTHNAHGRARCFRGKITRNSLILSSTKAALLMFTRILRKIFRY